METLHGELNTLPEIDVVVSPVSPALHPLGFGVEVARNAGHKLTQNLSKARQRLEREEMPEADPFVTPAYELNASKIYHIVTPTYNQGDFVEETVLRWCYQNCLHLAKSKKVESIGFPILGLSTGWPLSQAQEIANEELSRSTLNRTILVML